MFTLSLIRFNEVSSFFIDEYPLFTFVQDFCLICKYFTIANFASPHLTKALRRLT